MSITNENILEEIKRNREEVKSLIEAVELILALKLEDLGRRINKVEVDNKSIANGIERLDSKIRQKNIVIFGLKADEQTITTDFIKKEIKNLVGVNIAKSDLNNFYSLGKGNNPPVKIEFTTYVKK